jgi:hypothetical protein
VEVAAGRCIAMPPRVRTTDCVLAQKISIASTVVVGTKICCCCIWRSVRRFVSISETIWCIAIVAEMIM